MKNTHLLDKHIALGAKMVDFAGYNMPVYYTNIREEHLAVREGVGVFDVSHMGEFLVYGMGALDLLQKVTSNDVAKLKEGDVQYSCLPNLNGGIIDDLLVYRLPNTKEGAFSFLLVVNASNIDKDWDWINSQNDFGATLENISEMTGLLAIQGPKTTAVLQKLTETNLASIPYYNYTICNFAGIDDVLVSATGYTGSGGFEIYVGNKKLPALWDAIFEAGKEEGIQPIGLGARDTLRLEKGYCLYGNDIDDSTSPIEAGLGWITKIKKGTFNSSALFAQQKSEGVSRKLIGFKVEDRRVPRKDYPIQDEAGNEIGIVTSGTQSPSLNYPIGMGYVPVSFAKLDTVVYVIAGKKRLKAIVVKLPFLE